MIEQSSNTMLSETIYEPLLSAVSCPFLSFRLLRTKGRQPLRCRRQLFPTQHSLQADRKRQKQSMWVQSVSEITRMPIGI